MITDEELELIEPKFPNYSSAMIKAHAAYYRSCDPFYFLRIAAQFELPAYETGSIDEHGFDLLADNKERFEPTKASFLRYIRYLAAERFILLLVSGYPLGPAPRTFASVKNKRLAELLGSLSNKQVPDEMSLSASGIQLEFTDWVKHLAFQGANVDTDYSVSLADFVSKEAKFISNREAINAFKHGRAQAPISGQAFQLHVGKGEHKKPVFKEMEGAVHWLGWSERRSPQMVQHTLQIGFEEISSNSDFEIIKTLAAAEKLIIDLRRGFIAGGKTVDVFLPNLSTAATKHYPTRLSMNFDSVWNLQKKVET